MSPRARPEGPADYSILQRGLLVAYVWRLPGVLFPSGLTGKVAELPLLDAAVMCFSDDFGGYLTELSYGKRGLDAWLFALRLDGYEVREGEVRPGPHMRGL